MQCAFLIKEFRSLLGKMFSPDLWSVASCHLLAFLYSEISVRCISKSYLILSCFLTLHLCVNLNFGRLLTILFHFTNFLLNYVQAGFRRTLSFVYFNVSFNSEIASCFLFTFTWSCSVSTWFCFTVSCCKSLPCQCQFWNKYIQRLHSLL